MKCSNCGHETNGNFCEKCGSKMMLDNTSNNDLKKEKAKQISYSLILIGFFLIWQYSFGFSNLLDSPLAWTVYEFFISVIGLVISVIAIIVIKKHYRLEKCFFVLDIAIFNFIYFLLKNIIF